MRGDLGDRPLVRVRNRSQQQPLAQQTGVEVLVLRALPPNLLQGLVDELKCVLLQALLDLLVITKDGL